jgi:hypothetical protein
MVEVKWWANRIRMRGSWNCNCLEEFQALFSVVFNPRHSSSVWDRGVFSRRKRMNGESSRRELRSNPPENSRGRRATTLNGYSARGGASPTPTRPTADTFCPRRPRFPNGAAGPACAARRRQPRDLQCIAPAGRRVFLQGPYLLWRRN